MKHLATLLILATLACTGCAYIQDWIHDNPNPIPGPVEPDHTAKDADGFPSDWTQLGGKPLSKTATQAPLAKVLTATITGHKLNLTFDPIAKTGQWWAPHDGKCYGPHGFVYEAEGKWWSAYADWFPMELRPQEQLNIWGPDPTIPFSKHPMVPGCRAYWLAWNDAGNLRSNPVKVEWK